MQYGAEVRLIKDDGNIGECIKKCIRMAKNMKKNNPNVFLPNQFFNKDNPNAHELGTAQEIFKDLNGTVHGLCLGVGSGGTISGVGRALKVKNPSVMLYTCFGPRSASAMRHYPNFPTCNVDGSGVIRRDSTGNVKTYIDSKVLTDSGQYQANAMARIGYYCD